MAQLLFEVSHDGQRPRRFYLRDGLTIGREEGNDITLDDTKASGFHAKVIQRDGKYYVVDLGSSNKTHVYNGPSLGEGEEWALGEGVKFMVGASEFETYLVVIENEATIKASETDAQAIQAAVLEASKPAEPEPESEPVSEPKAKADPVPTDAPKEAPKRRASPLELPRDGGNHRGAFLAPHEDLAPGENNRPTTAEQFPQIDTGILRGMMDKARQTPPPEESKKPESPAKESKKPEAPAGPAGEAKTSAAFEVESTILSGSQVPGSSEGKTSASQVPIMPANSEGTSESTTNSLEIDGLLSKSLPRPEGPDPDDATILSPPSRPNHDDPTARVATDQGNANPPGETTDQVIVSRIMGEGDATVLSPRISANAQAETKKSDRGELRPENVAPEEPTVLSPSADNFSFVDPNDKTKAQASIVALEQRFSMMRPRLVFSHERFKFVARINNDEFTIGRASQKKAVSANCAIDDSSVSANHAAVLHRDGWFFLEDRDSRNGTTVDGRALQPMTRAKLKLDAAVKIGAVDALFIVDRNQKLAEPDRSHYRPALEYLVKQKLIRQTTAKDLWSAFSRENQHPGEKLILEGRIRVSQWTEALNAAVYGGSAPGAAGGYWRTLALATSAVAVIMVIVLSLIKLEVIPTT